MSGQISLRLSAAFLCAWSTFCAGPDVDDRAWLSWLQTATPTDIAGQQTEILAAGLETARSAVTRKWLVTSLARAQTPALELLPQLEILLSDPSPIDDEGPADWACAVLSAWGPAAAPAALHLAALVQQPSIPNFRRLRFLETLARVTRDSPEWAVTIAQWAQRFPPRGNAELEEACREALVLYGPAAKAAVPLLIRQLGHTSARSRQAVLLVLKGLGSAADVAAIDVADLAQTESDLTVQQTALETLARLGPNGIELLCHFLTVQEMGLRRAAASAAGHSPQRHPALLEGLQLSLTDSDVRTQAAAAESWWHLTRRPDPLEERLPQLLAQTDHEAARRASHILRRLPAWSPALRQALQDLAAQPNPIVARRAAAVLRHAPLAP